VALRIVDATYRYAGASRPAIESITLEISPGQIVGVTGANESGKSTLALLASGLAPGSIGGALEGSVLIDELDTRSAPAHALAQRCGVLFQNPLTQLSGTSRSVWEEIAFGPRNLALPLADVVERVNWAVATLGLETLIERDPGRLSGGQAQLVALAGVLAMRPAYLVLDEPTSELDPHGTRQVGRALAALADRTRVGVLLIEHKADLLRSLARDIVVIAAGRVRQRSAADAVLADESITELGVRPPESVALARAIRRAGKAIDERLLASLSATDGART
jgi:energy-coupling factor transport system ATP-binding protein